MRAAASAPDELIFSDAPRSPPHERVGVNARLIDEALLDGVPVKLVDGRSWDE